MGSSEYSLIILKNLISRFPVALITTQPDKPIGRGKNIEPALLKVFAEQIRIPVIQPKKINEELFRNVLNSHSIDLIIVAAYGKILPKWLLEYPKYGCVNVHASLLPRWRGASPIQAAILNGDQQTGATIIKMDEGIDTGPILSKKAVKIDPTDTGQSLSTKIAETGSELLIETLNEYLEGKIQPRPQNDLEATFAGLIKKEDGLLDFNQSAEALEKKIRAFIPWPICYFEWNSIRVRIFQAEISNEKKLKGFQRGIHNSYPSIGTSTNDLVLKVIQPSGKNKIDGKAFLNGARNWAN